MASDTSLVFNLVARDQASEALGSLKEKFSAAGTAIGAALGVGVGASLLGALDVEAANDKLAAQLGVGPAEAAKLAQVSAGVYKNAWGESTEDVNNAIKDVYLNIGDTSKAEGGLQGVTEKVIALRDTFEQESGSITAAVGQMLKTGLAKNADEAFDIITKGFQSGVNKADDFLDTLNEYGTQFRDLGLSGAQATGILKQGLQGGARDADLVADALKELNIRVQDQSAAKGLKALGLNGKQMAEAFAHGGPKATAALQTITDKLRGVTDPTKRYALAQQLLGTQSEDLSKALYKIDPSTAVKALGDVSGASDKMTKTLGDNPKAAIESFKRSVITNTTAIAGKFIDFAMKNKSAFVPLAATLGIVAIAVLAVQTGMMVWTAATTAWTVAQTIATGVQWAWNAALAANPIVWSIIGIVALVAVIVILWKKNEAFRNFIKAAWAMIWGAIKFVWDWVKTNWPLLLAVITGPIGLAVYWVLKHWDAIKKGTSAAWNAVWNWVKSVPGKIYNLFLNWTLPGLIIKHWSTIKNKTISIALATVNWVRSLPGRLVQAAAAIGTLLYNLARTAWNRFKQANIAIALSAVNWTRGLPNRVRNALGNLGSYLYNSGKALLRGFTNGIKAMASGPADAVRGALSQARNLLPFSPAKEGPFSGRGWTLYSGQSLVEGFADGVTSRASTARDAMLNVVHGAAEVSGQQMERPATAPTMGRNRQPIVIQFGTGQNKLIDALLQELRKEVRVKGGGNVQRALGG